MTRDEALAKWPTACAGVELKGRVVREGNWLPLANHLRHKDCEAAEVTVVEQDGSTILKIEPKLEVKDLPSGKSAKPRPAFLLIVQ